MFKWQIRYTETIKFVKFVNKFSKFSPSTSINFATRVGKSRIVRLS